MHKRFFMISLLFLVVCSFSVNAESVDKKNVPEKIFSYIHKNYPKAEGIKIEEKMHFGQPLYDVTFTVSTTDQNNQIHREKTSAFFRLNGHFYTNAVEVDKNAFNIISKPADQVLQQRYPEHELLAVKLIENPNGVGEEYEIDMMVSGKLENISIDDKGNIMSETDL